tara:strand:+ start:299 stop:490 length:192 start_codon:yes stop_codon:yes gene_type:complete
MTPKEAHALIGGMSPYDARDHLHALADHNLGLFETINSELKALSFMDELRDEEHNGHKMYPEL